MAEKIGTHIYPNAPLIEQSLLKRARELATPLFSDVMGRAGAMDYTIKPVASGMKVVGTAITVDLKPADNLFLHKALYTSGPGYVLVADAKGHCGNSPWGEIMTNIALKVGVNGVVLDGSVRDVEELRSLGFPVFAKGVNPRGGDKVAPGIINGPISCGGLPVNPGDLVFGDDDGVVIIPRDKAELIIGLAEEKKRQEEKRLEGVKAGKLEPAWVQENLAKLGL